MSRDLEMAYTFASICGCLAAGGGFCLIFNVIVYLRWKFAQERERWDVTRQKLEVERDVMLAELREKYER